MILCRAYRGWGMSAGERRGAVSVVPMPWEFHETISHNSVRCRPWYRWSRPREQGTPPNNWEASIRCGREWQEAASHP